LGIRITNYMLMKRVLYYRWRKERKNI